MSINQIMEWIEQHEGQKKKSDYFDIGNRTQHVIRFENGDTYQHIEVYKDMFHKTVETILNNQTVRHEQLIYKGFGWKAV